MNQKFIDKCKDMMSKMKQSCFSEWEKVALLPSNSKRDKIHIVKCVVLLVLKAFLSVAFRRLFELLFNHFGW